MQTQIEIESAASLEKGQNMIIIYLFSFNYIVNGNKYICVYSMGYDIIVIIMM